MAVISKIRWVLYSKIRPTASNCQQLPLTLHAVFIHCTWRNSTFSWLRTSLRVCGVLPPWLSRPHIDLAAGRTLTPNPKRVARLAACAFVQVSH